MFVSRLWLYRFYFLSVFLHVPHFLLYKCVLLLQSEKLIVLKKWRVAQATSQLRALRPEGGHPHPQDEALTP